MVLIPVSGRHTLRSIRRPFVQDRKMETEEVIAAQGNRKLQLLVHQIRSPAANVHDSHERD
jgi:hypothetical protein